MSFHFPSPLMRGGARGGGDEGKVGFAKAVFHSDPLSPPSPALPPSRGKGENRP
jgi:hypothetical protein